MSWTTEDFPAYRPFVSIVTSLPARLYRTTIGKKAIMATSGGVLVLFLIAHMVGNLKIFFGRDDYDRYANWLRTMGSPALPHRTLLTGLEIVLSVSVLAHMWSAVSLARTASRARPVRYAARHKAQRDRYAVHTMRYGGVVIAVFVIWHLLDLTFGVVNPKGDGSPYDKVVADFAASRWYITLFYVLAVVLVGLHLRHGLWSAFRTLGVTRVSRVLTDVLAALLVLGFVAVPFFVLIGVVKK